MKKTRFLFVLAVLCLLATHRVLAYDFEVGGIYYNIISVQDRTVSTVGHQAGIAELYIPAEVIYNNIKFKVTKVSGHGGTRNNYNNISVTLANGISTIGTYAFSYCANLKITIPPSIVEIEDGAFWDNSGNISVYIEDLTAWCNIDFKITTYWGSSNPLNATGTDGGYLYHKGTLVEDLVIPQEVKLISPIAFSGCKNIKSVTIKSNVNTIGYSAFWNCHNLESVFIANGVYSIGNSTFYGCSNLASVVLPESISAIPRFIFGYCPSLLSVTIPQKVKTIEEGAFANSGLMSIILPESLTKIDKSAFEGCNSLLSVTANMQTPFKIDKSVFSSLTYLNGKLMVPSRTREKYLNTESWNEFLNIEEQGQQDKIYLSVSCNSGGEVSFLGNTVSGQMKSVEVNRNQSITLTIAPADGYMVESATLNGNDIKDDLYNNTYTIAQIKENTDFRVEFAKTATYLSLRQPTGSMDIVVAEGESQTVRIVPESGYTIHSVTYNGVDVTNQLSADNTFVTPAITDHAVLYVTYEGGDDPSVSTKKYLTIKHSENGVMKQKIETGRAYTYKIAPLIGKTVKAILYNGQNVTTSIKSGRYTTPLIYDDATLEIVFE